MTIAPARQSRLVVIPGVVGAVDRQGSVIAKLPPGVRVVSIRLACPGFDDVTLDVEGEGPALDNIRTVYPLAYPLEPGGSAS